MTTPTALISDVIVRVQDEFLDADAPLTARELQRRVGTDGITCRAVLSTLVEAGVLVRLDDLYTRAYSPARPTNPTPVRGRQAA